MLERIYPGESDSKDENKNRRIACNQDGEEQIHTPSEAGTKSSESFSYIDHVSYDPDCKYLDSYTFVFQAQCFNVFNLQ